MVVEKTEQLDFADDGWFQSFQRVRWEDDTATHSSWVLTNNATERNISQGSN